MKREVLPRVSKRGAEAAEERGLLVQTWQYVNAAKDVLVVG